MSRVWLRYIQIVIFCQEGFWQQHKDALGAEAALLLRRRAPSHGGGVPRHGDGPGRNGPGLQLHLLRGDGRRRRAHGLSARHGAKDGDENSRRFTKFFS